MAAPRSFLFRIHLNKVRALLTTLILLPVWLLSACAGLGTPSPAAPPTATPPPAATQPPAATPEISVPASPAPTASPEPTVTPLPSPTPQPTATLAPSPTPDQWTGVDPSGQTIVFWHNFSYDRERLIKDIVAKFNAANEWGIRVEASYAGSYTKISQKMYSVLNTAYAPDLVVAYQNHAAGYALSDGLVDLSGLVTHPTWGLTPEEYNDFFPAFLEQDIFPSFGNARLGFPYTRSVEVLFYNQDWLEELGYATPPATPEEFKTVACQARDQPFSRSKASGSSGLSYPPDASTLASLTFAFGGEVFDPAANRYTYDSPAAVAALTFLQDLLRSGCALLVTKQYGEQTDFAYGRSLFSLGSSAGLPYYEKEVNNSGRFRWGVTALPHTTADPVLNVYGPSFSLPRTAPERELAAWLFVRYFTSPAVQARWAQASDYFPVRASAAESMAAHFSANPPYQAAFDMLKWGKAEPPTPGYDAVRTKVREALIAMLRAPYADVQSTLEQLNTEANTILAEQD